MHGTRAAGTPARASADDGWDLRTVIVATTLLCQRDDTAARVRPASVESSIELFRRHMVRERQDDGSTRVVDASAVLGAECYLEWSSSWAGDGGDSGSPRKRRSVSDDRVYQRTMFDSAGAPGLRTMQKLTAPSRSTGHVTATESRAAFEPDEEAAVLAQLRRKRVWPCFADTGSTIGAKGFRGFGFHEKLRMASLREAGEVLPIIGQPPVAMRRRTSPRPTLEPTAAAASDSGNAAVRSASRASLGADA